SLTPGTLGTATYDAPTVGSRTVTITGLALSGLHSGYYSLQPSTAEGQIYAKGVLIEGFTAVDKVYDGTGDATVDLTDATLSGVVDGNEVSFDPTTVVAYFSSRRQDINNAQPPPIQWLAQ